MDILHTLEGRGETPPVRPQPELVVITEQILIKCFSMRKNGLLLGTLVLLSLNILEVIVGKAGGSHLIIPYSPMVNATGIF